MKQPKRMIQIAQHKPTGAKIPVIVSKVDKNNVIQDYKEYMNNRKGFTIRMLENRWDKCREDVINLLQQYQVPAHVDHKQVLKLSGAESPVDIAVFFEEYIVALEKKEKLAHKKLKPKKLEILQAH